MPTLASNYCLLIVLVLIYGAFLFWYGGRGEPMTEDEVTQRLAAITASTGGKSQAVDQVPGEILAELKQLAASDDGNEFFMVNLIKYRQKALYPPGSDYDDSALAADSRYNRALVPYLLKFGGVPVFVGSPQGRFIDKSGDMEWDRVAVVRYRSRRDLFKMAHEIAPLGVAIHKWASIERTQVFPVAPILSLFTVRALVATILAVIGAVIHFLFFRSL
ncbi:MAG: hypothetical protein IPO38_02045 [Rhodocyclaceae bacterium]|nr:hypothetical protein [Rhodocyclaceae bacterium]